MKKLLFALAAALIAPVTAADTLVSGAPQTASLKPVPAPMPTPRPSGSKLALSRKFFEVPGDKKRKKQKK